MPGPAVMCNHDAFLCAALLHRTQCCNQFGAAFNSSQTQKHLGGRNRHTTAQAAIPCAASKLLAPGRTCVIRLAAPQVGSTVDQADEVPADEDGEGVGPDHGTPAKHGLHTSTHQW